MFTGIIEEVGTLLATRKASKSESLTIEAPYVLQDAKVGDSIAVNGICLTATSISGNTFTADVMAETMRRTSGMNPMSSIRSASSITRISVDERSRCPLRE